MRTRTPLTRRVIAALLLVQLTGCYSWHSTTISPSQVIAEEEPSNVRVTRTDGSQLTLADPFIRNRSIVSRLGQIGASVLLSDVSSLEVERFSVGKTVGLILGITVGFVVVLAAIYASSCSPVFESCEQGAVP